MFRKFLVAKIHKATVTGANVEYMGSITIDPVLLDEAGILPLEEVEVWDVTNGERFSTYCIHGARGCGEVVVNGAAARRVAPGDKVIVAAFGQMDDARLGPHVARVVVPDEKNRVARVFRYSTDLKQRTFEVVEGRGGEPDGR